MNMQVRYSPKCQDFRFDFMYSSTNNAYAGSFYYLNNYKFESPDKNWPSDASSSDDLRKKVEQQFDSNVVSRDRNTPIGASDDFIALIFDPRIISEIVANDLNIGEPYLSLDGGVPLTYTEIIAQAEEPIECNKNSLFLSDH